MEGSNEMNIKDAKSILYPVGMEEPKVPEFEKGKFYVVDGDTVEFMGNTSIYYRFLGCESPGIEYNIRYPWARDILARAIPALSWEVKDMLATRSRIVKAMSGYFDTFGTGNE